MSSALGKYGDPDTRQRILQATWDLIKETDAGVTVANAAKRAGVSRQAVYLHFGDRSGLLVGLVDYIDLSQGSVEMRSYVFGAPSGVESLRRWVETMSWYTAKIDGVSLLLEENQYHDEAMKAAWRNRMNRRQAMILSMAERIAGEERLADDWSVADAADFIYVSTMPAPWRELTKELGWSADQYNSRVWRVLSESLLKPDVKA